MDKQTLSNYGWIVVLILILIILLAFATPFGNFITTSIKNITQGFFDSKQIILESADIYIPDNKFEGGKTQNSDKDINQLKYGCLYLYEQDYNSNGFVFFENGSVIIIDNYISYILCPPDSVKTEKNKITISVDNVVVKSFEIGNNQIISISNNAVYLNKDDANLTVDNEFIYNIDKSIVYGYSNIYDQELKDVVVPTTVKTIKGSTFNTRQCVKTITIPETVTLIEPDAFTGCLNLTDIYFRGTETQWKTIFPYTTNITIHFI